MITTPETSARGRDRRRARAGVVALAIVFALMAVAGSASVVLRASAAWQEAVDAGKPGHLVLRSDPGSAQWTDLRPGDTVRWMIEASLADVDESTLSLQLRADGELLDAGEMTVSVESCTMPFQQVGEGSAPQCDGSSETVLESGSLAAVARDESEIYELADLHRALPRHLLVSLSLAASADLNGVADATARIGVGLHASGETPPSSPQGELATTGSDLTGDIVAISLLGGGLIGLGVTATLWRRTRRTAEEVAA